MNETKDEIIIYTDGGCSGNPGPGGWGVVIIENGNSKEFSGGEKLTTNNRMELTAAINALTFVKNSTSSSEKKIILYSDSQYVKNGITTWIKNWKSKGWITSGKEPVKNKDLWILLDELNNELEISWNWVKGHAGIEFNEICDNLCQKEIKKWKNS